MRLRATKSTGAGTRDHWVTIQSRPDDSIGNSGFPVDAPWSDLATVAMARVDLEADERERSAQQLALTTTQWEMPFMVEMDPERVDVAKLRRLVYAGRAFDILGAIPIGREVGIAILTETFGQTLPPAEIPAARPRTEATR